MRMTMESIKFCLLAACLLPLLATTATATASEFPQEEVICTDPIGYISHPDCRFYYVCINFVPTLRQCDSGLYFSSQTNSCDFPQNVPECVGGTNRPILTTTEMPVTTTEEPEPEPSTTEEPPVEMSTTEPPVEASTTEPPMPITTEPQPSTPAPEPTTTEELTTPDPGGPIVECPPDGTHNLPYPGNCSLYVACFNGDPYVLDCTPLTFDKIDMTCKPAADAVCDEESPVQCPPTGYTTLAHGSSCSHYYACFEGESFELECAANTYYDATKEVASCNLAQVAHCDSECPQGGIHYRAVRVRGCEWYKICFSGVAVNVECPEDQVYSPGQGSCVGVDDYLCPYA